MTTQLGLFAPAPKPEPPPPRAPDPWAWRVDYVETDRDERLYAWLAHPRPDLWLHVELDGEQEKGSLRYAWRVERLPRPKDEPGDEVFARGLATTKRRAMDAAEEAARGGV